MGTLLDAVNKFLGAPPLHPDDAVKLTEWLIRYGESAANLHDLPFTDVWIDNMVNHGMLEIRENVASFYLSILITPKGIAFVESANENSF